MKVIELVNACQNQWKGLFDYNKDFKIVFTFEDCENIESWTLEEFYDYSLDGKQNWFIINQLKKRHEQNVLSWKMVTLNSINVLVKEF